MFIFLDTETTGTGPEDRLCQIAFKPEGEPAVCELFNPGRPIAIDAGSWESPLLSRSFQRNVLIWWMG